MRNELTCAIDVSESHCPDAKCVAFCVPMDSPSGIHIMYRVLIQGTKEGLS